MAGNIETLPIQLSHHPVKQEVRESLTLVNLNIAHGRGLSLNQLLVSHEKIQKNLTESANFLRQTGGDIVALQEADAPSYWSGNFHHVEFVAAHGEYA